MLVRRLSAFVLATLLPLLLTSAALAQTSDQGDAGAGCAGCGCAGLGLVAMIVVPILVGLVILVLNIVLMIWVNRDAKARGMENAVIWMLLIFFTGPLGWAMALIYIFSRTPGNLIACPHCGNKRLAVSRTCPHCGNE
jgi:hypothetical protein